MSFRLVRTKCAFFLWNYGPGSRPSGGRTRRTDRICDRPFGRWDSQGVRAFDDWERRFL